jgi:hypothetical protein
LLLKGHMRPSSTRPTGARAENVTESAPSCLELLGRSLLPLAARQSANVGASGLPAARGFATIWYRAATCAVRLAARETLAVE